MTTQNLSDKAAAAAFRAIEALLPQVLRLGALAALEASEPPQGSGLNWANLPADELLKMDSESAQFERLRRSVSVLEAWNLRCGLGDRYAPTAQLLSSLAGVGEDVAAQWLQRPSVRNEMHTYLKRLNLAGKTASDIANFNRVKPNGDAKPDARSVVSWEEF